MTSINNTPGQDLFIAAFNQVEPKQKKQLCRQLKEMFPDHPMVAQIAKVSHLINWSKTKQLIVNSQINYLSEVTTVESALIELLWNSHMGGKEIERGNLLLFRIFDSIEQYKLTSKLANRMIEKNDALGLSASVLAFMQALGLQESNPKQALALYDKVINDPDSASSLIASAKFQKAQLIEDGGPGVQIDRAEALDLYSQIINDEHASMITRDLAKFNKAQLLQRGGQGVQIDRTAALDLYNQLINDVRPVQPELIAEAKYNKAQLLQRGGQGVQIDCAAALDLYSQVINDEHASSDFIARAKFQKAMLLQEGRQGVQIDRAAALDLYNQVIYDEHALPYLIALAKFFKVTILRDSHALPSILLKAAYETRDTPHWQEVLTLLREKFGGENFPRLISPEERFYSMLLLDEPETILNHLKEHGRPPQRFIGGMKSFLTYLLTADLSDFSDFQTQVLEAVRANYRSLEKFQLNLNTEETLSKICYEAAQKYAEEANHELADWFYEQIPFGSSKYAEGLEGALMLHSNLALAENPSFIHRYKAVKYIKRKIDKYSHHLRAKQNASQNQKDIIHALLRQIDEIKDKAKKELKTQAPTPSLMTGLILQMMEARDALIPRTSKRTGNDAELADHPPPKCARTEDDSIR